jgi:hypothetical protein
MDVIDSKTGPGDGEGDTDWREVTVKYLQNPGITKDRKTRW